MGELEHHQGKCIFRHVFCPDMDCEEGKVMFKDVSEHLLTVHENDSEWKMEEEIKNQWLPLGRFENDSYFDSTAPWDSYPQKITSIDGDVFYEVGFKVNNAFRFVIYFLGSPEEAKNFSCKILVTNKDGEEFSYTSKVHTFDERKDDIIASETCFK